MTTTLHRRAALKLLAGVGTLGLFAACSPSSSPPPAAAPTAASKPPAPAATSAPAAAGAAAPTTAPAAGGTTKEIVHWSWLTASDGEVWQQMIDSFNTANKS